LKLIQNSPVISALCAAPDTALNPRKSESSLVPAHLYSSKQALCADSCKLLLVFIAR
jgi:hypothetical protein